MVIRMWFYGQKAPGRLADIVNVYCHGGRQVVKAEDVTEADAVRVSFYPSF